MIEPSVHRICTFTGQRAQITCTGSIVSVESKIVSEIF